MGEWSKKIGEYGEDVVEQFLNIIGWEPATGITLKCLDEKHLNEKGNPKTTHGKDLFYAYKSPLVSEQLNNIVISSKFETTKYPSSPTQLFKSHMNDLISTMECYAFSETKQDMAGSFQFSSAQDVGVLFWLNNVADSNDDLISVVSSAKIEFSGSRSVYIVDNKRFVFILEVMKYIKTQELRFNYEFYYHNTGRNINQLDRINDGRILPVEFINSSIILAKLTNKDNPKEICFFIATLDNYDSSDFIRLIALAQEITTNLVAKVIIGFPDFDELKHKADSDAAKNKFQKSSFTRNVKIINYLNPLSALS